MARSTFGGVVHCTISLHPNYGFHPGNEKPRPDRQTWAEALASAPQECPMALRGAAFPTTGKTVLRKAK